MNCLSAMFKYLLYLLNLIFVAGGILLIVVGSIMLSTMGNFSSFDGANNTQTIPITIIVIGCVTFVVAFFGCCGTIRENACCTTIYTSMMFVLFILQLVLTCWVFVNRSAFLGDMSNLVRNLWNNQEYTAMGVLEDTFGCCGNTGYLNYKSINLPVPGTCCGYLDRQANCTDASVYQQRPGCNAKFTDFWYDNMDIIRWSGLGICIFELLVFLIAGALTNCMRRQNAGRQVYA
ncbi:hypothetical protein KR009_010041 [Drosophila setifemur]|nr:hypothetical protein KR009_010041 [Drosophila setifemur]